MKIEYCSECGNPTGRAGRSEDSLYLGTEEGFNPEVGPLCEECYSELKPYEPDEDDMLKSRLNK